MNDKDFDAHLARRFPTLRVTKAPIQSDGQRRQRVNELIQAMEKKIRIEKYSSHVDSISYDADKLELTVNYTTGKSATYSGVPVRVFREINSAPSIGKALHQMVKGKYSFTYTGGV